MMSKAKKVGEGAAKHGLPWGMILWLLMGLQEIEDDIKDLQIEDDIKDLQIEDDIKDLQIEDAKQSVRIESCEKE